MNDNFNKLDPQSDVLDITPIVVAIPHESRKLRPLFGGTAVVVDGDTVITAAHTLEFFEHRLGRKRLSMSTDESYGAEVRVGKEYSIALFFQPTKMHPEVRIIPAKSWLRLPRTDLAVLYLSENVFFHPLLELDASCPYIGQKIISVGVKKCIVQKKSVAGKGSKIVYKVTPSYFYSKGIITNPQPRINPESEYDGPFHESKMLALGGFSGGPVFSDDKDKLRLIGIVSKSWEDNKYASKIVGIGLLAKHYPNINTINHFRLKGFNDYDYRNGLLFYKNESCHSKNEKEFTDIMIRNMTSEEYEQYILDNKPPDTDREIE